MLYRIFTSPSQAVIWRGPMASKAWTKFFDADWEN
jgi:Mrp family chromosome partitioning ATPase